MSSLQDSVLLGVLSHSQGWHPVLSYVAPLGLDGKWVSVTAQLISPEGCTVSNRRQRLRTMLTSHRSCLEGNTSHTRGTAFQAFI